MYPWLAYSEIKKFIPEMEKLGVSKVARGEEKSSATDEGFIEVYKKIRKPEKMYEEKATRNQSWGERRDNFISRHLKSYNDNPTYRRRLALIAWAYDPEKKTKYGLEKKSILTDTETLDLSRYEKLESNLKKLYIDI